MLADKGGQVPFNLSVLRVHNVAISKAGSVVGVWQVSVRAANTMLEVVAAWVSTVRWV